jgi:hypothetical protein
MNVLHHSSFWLRHGYDFRPTHKAKRWIYIELQTVRSQIGNFITKWRYIYTSWLRITNDFFIHFYADIVGMHRTCKVGSCFDFRITVTINKCLFHTIWHTKTGYWQINNESWSKTTLHFFAYSLPTPTPFSLSIPEPLNVRNVCNKRKVKW